MKRALIPFLAGALFALGLGVSGMTRPSKVLGFLDVAGPWDASLAFVMGGAVLVGLVAFRVILRRSAPMQDGAFALPPLTGIDGRLALGAALFGVGWGLGGYCPGPALVALVSLSPATLVFVAAMVTGMIAFRLFDEHQRARATGGHGAPLERESPAGCG